MELVKWSSPSRWTPRDDPCSPSCWVDLLSTAWVRSVPYLHHQTLSLLFISVGLSYVFNWCVCVFQIITDRPHFHDESSIYPVGFCSTRVFASVKNPQQQCLYTCQIKDGGHGPQVKNLNTKPHGSSLARVRDNMSVEFGCK